MISEFPFRQKSSGLVRHAFIGAVNAHGEVQPRATVVNVSDDLRRSSDCDEDGVLLLVLITPAEAAERVVSLGGFNQDGFSQDSFSQDRDLDAAFSYELLQSLPHTSQLVRFEDEDADRNAPEACARCA